MNNNENHRSVVIERSTVEDFQEGIDKSIAQIIVELIEYIPNSVLSKTIMKKTTGNVTVVSFDTGEALTEKISPFDTFIQIIEGKAEIIIDKTSNCLECGQGIIIPAHSSHVVKANGRFKMTQTVIKSGYE
ncbi:MAG TPA: cupin domain-containing protein [Chitinophagaceae bacterium]|nr:cupin domain-containing protein [Chitinophagaceae bacterium]